MLLLLFQVPRMDMSPRTGRPPFVWWEALPLYQQRRIAKRIAIFPKSTMYEKYIKKLPFAIPFHSLIVTDLDLNIYSL